MVLISIKLKLLFFFTLLTLNLKYRTKHWDSVTTIKLIFNSWILIIRQVSNPKSPRITPHSLTLRYNFLLFGLLLNLLKIILTIHIVLTPKVKILTIPLIIYVEGPYELNPSSSGRNVKTIFFSSVLEHKYTYMLCILMLCLLVCSICTRWIYDSNKIL